ncbi:hypothetical protein KC19_7G049700 [Ceratodon purpureus]|uniref:Beta-Casp domain-containing protein n=1 Tax=Ceratodon purpureus TaxID=3225 RepID=A0A8T0H4R0_CERPU|nr:hypothetical protein KC19_7G049700 [Ceratodon purpureus]
MKLTSLGCGKDPIQESGLACHLLDANQSCVLLECPLDLSALALFLPAPSSTHSVFQSSSRLGQSSEATLHGAAGRKRKGKRDVHRDVLLRSSTKRVCLNNEVCERDGAGETGRDKGGEHKISSLFKEIHGQVLADGEPWYKVGGLELVDVGLLDAVIVSNPSGMLGLPFLTRHPDFCGKIYATKATAEIGKIMMEELVVLHADFTQKHGSLRTGQKPPWLDPSILGTMPVHMRSSLLGRCFSNRGNWQALYSAQDIQNCFVHVHKLRLGEEANINGSLRVMPLSSGMGIGASNWILSGARERVGYLAASLATKNHAMPLDKAPLAGCHALIISDVEFSPEAVVTEKAVASREDLVVNAPEISERGVLGSEHVGPLGPSSGSGSSQRPTQRASGSFSSVAVRGGLSSSSVGAVKSGSAGLPLGTGVEKAVKAGSGDLDGTPRNDLATSDLIPEVAAACKGAIEAVRRGGSVLFPISPSGLLLQILEELGVQLAALNLKHVPIHYISTAAEETLAYCNTVPEWLCSARQEKLYAGESLFGYVDLVQEGRLRHSKAFSSPELQKVWQEPCIVFAAHFSLRMGPAVHLLHRWRQNPLCLLILTEGESDKDLLLAPYMPLSMQVLELRASLQLRSEEVASLLQSIQPQCALVPEFLQKSLEGAGSTSTKALLGYKEGRSVQVPNFETDIEVSMSAELALQVQPKLVKPKKVAAAPFQAEFCFRDGNLSLQIPTTSSLSSDYQYRWGQVSVGALSRALQERGIGDISFHDPPVDESSTSREGHATERKTLMVEIRSPSRAWIELEPNRSHIKANEPSLRRLIADAINSVLQVM